MRNLLRSVVLWTFGGVLYFLPEVPLREDRRQLQAPTCRNANSIGIELCCHRRVDGTWYFDAVHEEDAGGHAGEVG